MRHVENVIFDYSSTWSEKFFLSHSQLSYTGPSLSELDRMGNRVEEGKVFLMTSIQPRERMERLVTGMGERDIGLNWDRWQGREMEAAVLKATTGQVLKKLGRGKAGKSSGNCRITKDLQGCPHTLTSFAFGTAKAVTVSECHSIRRFSVRHKDIPFWTQKLSL